jgi:hypothetical protein
VAGWVDWGAGGQRTVNVINGLFQEENIGYELTDFQDLQDDNGFYKTIGPTGIKESEKLLHQEAVKPCLHVLADKKFRSADTELRAAFEEYRKGKYADSITDAGAAVESVLKSICKAKKWTYRRLGRGEVVSGVNQEERLPLFFSKETYFH